MTRKRIPADTTLDYPTFLNDKKINGELYALLQSYSDYEVINKNKNEFFTYVMKQKLPVQSQLCNALGIKSPKTLRAHLAYLIDKGFIVEEQDRYLLPEMENIYFLIPLETLQYLNDNCKEHIIKIYTYLATRWNQMEHQGRKDYYFTAEELGDHVGIKVKNNSRAYSIINNALNLLYSVDLIDYENCYDGQKSYKKLIKVNTEYKKKIR